MSVILPQELCTFIIGELQSDSKCLKSCSLVSRSWTLEAHRLLFRDHPVRIGRQQDPPSKPLAPTLRDTDGHLFPTSTNRDLEKLSDRSTAAFLGMVHSSSHVAPLIRHMHLNLTDIHRESGVDDSICFSESEHEDWQETLSTWCFERLLAAVLEAPLTHATTITIFNSHPTPRNSQSQDESVTYGTLPWSRDPRGDEQALRSKLQSVKKLAFVGDVGILTPAMTSFMSFVSCFPSVTELQVHRLADCRLPKRQLPKIDCTTTSLEQYTIGRDSQGIRISGLNEQMKILAWLSTTNTRHTIKHLKLTPWNNSFVSRTDFFAMLTQRDLPWSMELYDSLTFACVHVDWPMVFQKLTHLVLHIGGPPNVTDVGWVITVLHSLERAFPHMETLELKLRAIDAAAKLTPDDDDFEKDLSILKLPALRTVVLDFARDEEHANLICNLFSKDVRIICRPNIQAAATPPIWYHN